MWVGLLAFSESRRFKRQVFLIPGKMVGRCMELGPPGQSPSLLPLALQGLAVASPDGMRAAQDSVSGV